MASFREHFTAALDNIPAQLVIYALVFLAICA